MRSAASGPTRPVWGAAKAARCAAGALLGISLLFGCRERVQLQADEPAPTRSGTSAGGRASSARTEPEGGQADTTAAGSPTTAGANAAGETGQLSASPRPPL